MLFSNLDWPKIRTMNFDIKKLFIYIVLVWRWNIWFRCCRSFNNRFLEHTGIFRAIEILMFIIEDTRKTITSRCRPIFWYIHKTFSFTLHINKNISTKGKGVVTLDAKPPVPLFESEVFSNCLSMDWTVWYWPGPGVKFYRNSIVIL